MQPKEIKLKKISKEQTLLYVSKQEVPCDITALPSLFERYDCAENFTLAYELYLNISHDIIIVDMPVDTECIGFLKEVYGINKEQPVLVLIDAKSDKLTALNEFRSCRSIFLPCERGVVLDLLHGASLAVMQQRSLLDAIKDANRLAKEKNKLEKRIIERTKTLSYQSKYVRAILDSQRDIVYVRNENNIIDANRSFFEFFDFVKKEDIFRKRGGNICTLFERVDEEGFIYDCEGKEWLEELVENPQKPHKVKIIKNSKEYIFNISANTMHFKADHIENKSKLFILNLSDITELETMRSEKLRNITLASIGRLAAGVTHEINTPLTYAKGNLEMMKFEIEEIEGSEAKRFLEEGVLEIEEGLGRISNIVESMREIGGKGSGVQEKIEVMHTIDMSLVMLKSRAKHITPIFINGREYDENMEVFKKHHYIQGVKQRIEQVWIVLVNNALDEFINSDIPFDERRIDINIREDEYCVRVQVRDNAGGIKQDIMHKLFEPFSSNKTVSGMGIGLNIAKQTVEEHRGCVSARNEEGGAVFEVKLPKYEKRDTVCLK